MTGVAPYPEPAVEETSTPTFERVLCVFESAPAGTPFDPAHVLVLRRLQRAARDHYARHLDAMLEAADVAQALPLALVRGAQMLNRRMGNALTEAVLRQLLRPRRLEEQIEVAELALCALRARAEEIKWHGFERTTMQRTSWRQANALMLAIEAAGLERRPLTNDATCTDAFAQCLLLASLNVGILSAPQLELAHRWLATSAHDMRVEPFFDPEAHWYQVDLARAAGPERISATSAVADTTRFVAVAPLGDKLAQARVKLYAGELSVGATPSRLVALHFGAFLDLAERLWSPDWRRASWRAEREKADGESIEVVLGFDNVLAALEAEDTGAPAAAASSWALRDRSSTGLGALLPKDAGVQVPLGALIAFRAAPGEPWELGCVVRRIRGSEDALWMVGIRRLSSDPLVIDLEPYAEGLRLEGEAAPTAAAIYAPINADSGRVDGLVIAAREAGKATDYLLTTANGAFRIRANRVIDRAEHWVRVGFEVLGKK
ncbi:MAG: hypothetical protein IT531_06470 [Burkholderiales bacterium]|nr:hypothetical protein [Burkholderiales bacterium]